MGLILRARRACGIWHWRLRYWWLDTPAGRHAQLWAFALSVLATLLQLVRIAVAAVVPPSPGTPRQAVYWWVVQLIILVVSAAISYAMRPKTEKPKPAAGEAPTVEDGQAVKHHFGTVWIEDEFILAWKVTGTVPIKSKGGKK
jgi:hypothetical protein